MRYSFLAGVAVLASAAFPGAVYGQLNQKRGNAPGDVPQTTYFVHRLSSDHAEGITTLDMNGDGRPDIVSGAYWYENPGPGAANGSGTSTAASISWANSCPTAASG